MELATINMENKNVPINQAHQMLGHAAEDKMRQTAKLLGWHLIGKLQQCEDCAISKAKQKNLHKQVKNPATEKGERWSIDIASMKNTSNSGSKYWLLIVDDFTNMM